MPTPVAGLIERVAKYKAVLEVGGQSVNLSMDREVKQEDGNWVITESVQTPMGNAEERAVLEKDSLVLLNRKVTQGPVSIDVSFAGNKVSGTMTVNDSPKKISVDLGGMLFATAPARAR